MITADDKITEACSMISAGIFTGKQKEKCGLVQGVNISEMSVEDSRHYVNILGTKAAVKMVITQMLDKHLSTKQLSSLILEKTQYVFRGFESTNETFLCSKKFCLLILHVCLHLLAEQLAATFFPLLSTYVFQICLSNHVIIHHL